MDEKQVFTAIYAANSWGNSESVSGSGSTVSATQFLVPELNQLLRSFQIRSMVDIPCGDFNWMQHVDLDGIQYIGADIVDDLISANREQFPGVNFEVMNLISDPLPRVDLVLCRDCLFHLPDALIMQALQNIRRSGSRFLLTTTFAWKSLPNKEGRLGDWRRLNLELPPFNLPPPAESIIEGTYRDKSMALWPVYQLPQGLDTRQ